MTLAWKLWFVYSVSVILFWMGNIHVILSLHEVTTKPLEFLQIEICQFSVWNKSTMNDYR